MLIGHGSRLMGDGSWMGVLTLVRTVLKRELAGVLTDELEMFGSSAKALLQNVQSLLYF